MTIPAPCHRPVSERLPAPRIDDRAPTPTLTPPRAPAARQTAEQREWHARLVALVGPVLGGRVRIIRDVNSFSIVPGRLGQLEYLGCERDGHERLYVFTGRPRLIARLAAIPGVHSHQIGDGEARLWFAASNAVALRSVAQAIRTRVRRTGSTASVAALARARAARTSPAEHGRGR